MKKVSIITVCYNSISTIKRTIESVLKQTYENIEYIIVDGGSSDGTVELIKSFEDKFGARLKWISEKDDGIYDAMNKGIHMASGELIGIINSDDYYELDAVAHMIDAMTEDPYQILYGYMKVWKDNILQNISIVMHDSLPACMLNHPTCFVTKKIYDDLGAFDIQYCSVADYDFLIRMHQNDQVKFIPVFENIANFSTGGMCSSHTAYIDLLKLQHNYHMISNWQYYKDRFKAELAYRMGH